LSGDIASRRRRRKKAKQQHFPSRSRFLARRNSFLQSISPIIGLFKFVRLHEAAAFIVAPAARPTRPEFPTLRSRLSSVSVFAVAAPRQNEDTAIRAGRRRRTPQITVKNGRPKLPCVSLMLLTLITSEWDLILSLFLPFLHRRGLEGEDPLSLYDLISGDTPLLPSLPRIVPLAIKARAQI
jgi:hypothetical protein